MVSTKLKSPSSANKYRNSALSHSLFNYTEKLIVRYHNYGQHRTGETYRTTLNSFKRFRAYHDLHLKDFDSKLVESYKSYLKQNGLCPNTISFYLKHLKSIYNRAVNEELIVDKKPFKQLTTATEKTAKRAISLKVIKQLKMLDCSHYPAECFARDMFLFSFYTRGMSFVDIAHLQKKNLKGDLLIYRRRKTNQQLTIHWEPCMQAITNTYPTDSSSPYLLPIIKDFNNNQQKQYKRVQFLINRHLKNIGKRLGLNHPLTMYCARHSWASIAYEKGIPISVISEGMGHDSEKTTRIYLTSLKTEVIDNANRKILNLL